MSELIIRNKLNDLVDDSVQSIPIIIQFLKDFKAKVCLFCFQSDVKFLCQCKNCGYYFCNNNHRRTSHIVLHLKKCKHFKIALPPFDSELKCEECPNKDIFSLYFKGEKILCENCWKIKDEISFEKIVEDKKINENILMSPGIPPLANRIDSFTESLITKLNEKINYLMVNNTFSISLFFPNIRDYCKRYKTLLNIEFEEKERRIEENETVLFHLTFYKEDEYISALIKYSNQEFFFYRRQLLRVMGEDNENKYVQARVINVDKSSKSVTLFFKDLKKTLIDGVYAIKEDDSFANYGRMQNGLKLLKRNDSLMDKNILSLILGKETIDDGSPISNINSYLDESLLPEILSIFRLINIKLNKSQEFAIRNCFRHKLNLIKGPPGTGKSTVLLFLTYYLLQCINSFDKIFIGAPSNRAVDNISSLLQKLDINFVRVLSMEKELSGGVDRTNSLEDLIEKEIEKDLEKNKLLKKLKEKKNKYGFLSEKENKEYEKIIGQYQFKIVNSTQIILATLNNSSDPRIENCEFPIVIIDEATQTLEPDCLLPLIHKAKMVVMIGDEKQLGPTIFSKENQMGGLGVSLFERLCYLYKGSDFICTLNEQYRGHESLFEFSNEHFYNNELIHHGGILIDENVKNIFPWPDKDIPMLFYHVDDEEKEDNSSYYNEKEIYNVYGVVHKLMKAGVNIKDIGIITPYDAQKKKLLEKFYADKFKDLQIESVDGFQGMEKDYMIISAVRSNFYGDIGFLTSTKRLNVALTRAKKGVIIIGNAKCLAKKHGIWKDLVKYYTSKKLIVKGPLSNLELVQKKDIFNEDLEDDDEEQEKIMINRKRGEMEAPAPCVKIDINEIKEVNLSDDSENERISTEADEKDNKHKNSSSINKNINQIKNKCNIKNQIKVEEKKHDDNNYIGRRKRRKIKRNKEIEEEEKKEEKEDKKEEKEEEKEEIKGKKNKKDKKNKKEEEEKKEEIKEKKNKKGKKNKKEKSPEKKIEDKKEKKEKKNKNEDNGKKNRNKKNH